VLAARLSLFRSARGKTYRHALIAVRQNAAKLRTIARGFICFEYTMPSVIARSFSRNGAIANAWPSTIGPTRVNARRA
jgi:hypothetical protein